MPLEKACIQVYTGNGKGKKTAALGLVFRPVSMRVSALSGRG